MTDVAEAPARPQRSYASLSEVERLIFHDELQGFLAKLSPRERAALRYSWKAWRRPQQVPPAVWRRIWLLKAGRGFGKTRTGAETTREEVEKHDLIGLVAPTASDVRDVMVEGESGLMSVFPPDQRPDYKPSLRKITFHNGAVGHLYSADEPERLRGPQHKFVWGDEPASWRYGEAAFDNALLGLRLGSQPRMLLTGTPKPTAWLRAMSVRPNCIVTGGTTYENWGNLAEVFLEDVLGRYEGTRLGRQELHAEWLDDVEGALWTEDILQAARMSGFSMTDPWLSLNAWLLEQAQPMVADKRRQWITVVGVDPPGETAECGIVVASAPYKGQQGRDHAVVLDDMSLAGRPEQWGAQVVAAWRKHQAQAVIVEKNQGGDMCRAVIHAVDPNCPVKTFSASESKADRAEPIAALDERGLIHHVGFFPQLESQMVTWVPAEGKSPDRIDARVHALRWLLEARVLAPSRIKRPQGALPKPGFTTGLRQRG